MDKLFIKGRSKLKGKVRTSGSKNSVLPIMAACLLTKERSVIKNVPDLSDVRTMVRLLQRLGAKVEFCDRTLIIEPGNYKGDTATYKFVSVMRASVCVLGPLLAKQKTANVSLPGGCVIGPRPVDLHIKGLKALGADIDISHGYLIAKAKQLQGANMYLGGAYGSSVLATGNIMMAATLAKGKTTIENAACEPEVVDLAEMLIKMGAKIKGHKTHTIEIEGVKSLGGASHTTIPDRIEAGTFMIAAAMSSGDVIIEGARADHLGALIDKLKSTGAHINSNTDGIKVKGGRTIKPVDVVTLPFPGFPTDLQAQITAMMCLAKGISIVTEKIYPERFMHISELNRMGADIILEGESAIIKGQRRLMGAPVMASDLRASAALVLAGLVGEGTTEISRIYHLDRGYENIEQKLASLGAKIWREKEK
ncbi:MAG: UDP-N-acetylglucosamine 1-carboxyvinyltransferase [Candidatus Omnitrophica bacterium]|nr:UDP-N-acetylglucosamine 1-carboxyvinyltransferase [Candidatus Omnitrophota bacterium]